MGEIGEVIRAIRPDADSERKAKIGVRKKVTSPINPNVSHATEWMGES